MCVYQTRRCPPFKTRGGGLLPQYIPLLDSSLLICKVAPTILAIVVICIFSLGQVLGNMKKDGWALHAGSSHTIDSDFQGDTQTTSRCLGWAPVLRASGGYQQGMCPTVIFCEMRLLRLHLPSLSQYCVLFSPFAFEQCFHKTLQRNNLQRVHL